MVGRRFFSQCGGSQRKLCNDDARECRLSFLKALFWNPLVLGARQIWDRFVSSDFSSLMACFYLTLSDGDDRGYVLSFVFPDVVSIDPYPSTA
jgi:hypothetical protein